MRRDCATSYPSPGGRGQKRQSFARISAAPELTLQYRNTKTSSGRDIIVGGVQLATFPNLNQVALQTLRETGQMKCNLHRSALRMEFTATAACKYWGRNDSYEMVPNC